MGLEQAREVVVSKVSWSERHQSRCRLLIIAQWEAANFRDFHCGLQQVAEWGFWACAGHVPHTGLIQETGSYCALKRRGEDTPPSPMIRKCCCLAQQWCDCLRLRLDELRNHREGSMMPPAACLARQNHKFSISVRPSQLRVGCFLIRHRS